MTQVSKRCFGMLSNVAGSFIDRMSYAATRMPPERPLQDHAPIELSGQVGVYNKTTLTNGVTILTESTSFPSNVNMGILVNAGSRDETHHNAGVCFSLASVALKTNSKTNEQLNYCMV